MPAIESAIRGICGHQQMGFMASSADAKNVGLRCKLGISKLRSRLRLSVISDCIRPVRPAKREGTISALLFVSRGLNNAGRPDELLQRPAIGLRGQGRLEQHNA
jgi:hypothetical protein